MPDAEKPRVAKAAPAGRFASLSKRQWQDIRRARKLGADGLGGGLRVHGVEIFFPRPLKDVIHTATNGGQNGQRGGERRDDSQHTASRPDSRRQTGATPTRNARQQRQHDRLLAFKKATRHRLSSIFRAWAEAARATEEGALQPSHGVRSAWDDLYEQRGAAAARLRALQKQPGVAREEVAAARARFERLDFALVEATPLPGEEDHMDDERAPKRGHSSPADAGRAAAKGPSTPARAAGGASSASGTPPRNQPKRPRNLLPPSITDGKEQALQEASETLAARAGDGKPARPQA